MIAMKRVAVPKNVREKHPYHRPAFVKRTVGIKALPRTHATYESRKEWRQDPKGYFIIKVFYKDGYFGARYHTNDHAPKQDIVGTNAEAIVQTIVREGLVTSLQHAAYLGHELMKAEIALEHKLNFVQDSPLNFSKKTKKQESDNLPE
jgi:hypothetical protein